MSATANVKTQNLEQVKESSLKNKGDKQIEKLKKIITKPLQIRNHSDNQFISQFISNDPHLDHIVEQVSLQFVKNLFKKVSIIQLPPHKIICSQNEQINYLYSVLQGCAISLKRSQPFITQLQAEDTITRLIDISVSYIKALKRQSKLPTSKIVADEFRLQYQDYQQHLSEQNVQKYIHAHQDIGMFDLSCKQNFLNTIITKQNVTLLVLPKKHIMICLQQAFKEKTNQLLGSIKSIPCFGSLQTQKIKSIIQNMNFRKKKRSDFLYSQGDKAHSIFFLSKGQVKITKQTNLFMENPNSLYVNRVQLLQDLYKKDQKQMDRLQKMQTQRKKKKSILPYANLTSLYNYRPIKKTIQIGVLSPFCLFGEQQFIQDKQRQTNAFCQSLQIEYYEIQMKKVRQVITTKQLPNFMKIMKNSMRKKILYRQNQYASNINLENRNNLDYFYFEGNKSKEQPRKFKIEKFNSRLQSQDAISKTIKQPNVPAYYTSFNFNKLVNKPKIQKQTNNDHLEEMNEQNSQTQKKLMDISHTWKLMQKKVQLEIRTSKKISPYRHVVNLKKPLIEAEYFYNVDKQKKRIERDYRKRVLSLGKKYINRSIQE